MAWRAARSLLVLQQQLQAGAPRARPPGTGADEWGLIGDAAHDPTSDHTPHNFPGWGNQIVTAADCPNRPDLGLDMHQVLDDIRRSHDARVKYGISNGQMFSSYAVAGYPAWTWRPYNPKNGDRHFTHGHLSVVGDPRADGEQPWATIGAPTAAALEEDDDEMGASFGPVQLNVSESTSLCIPPVQAGIADPREVWLNAGADMDGGTCGLRIWGSNGDGSYFAVGNADGVHTLRSGVALSIQLPKGLRLLTIKRLAPDTSGTPQAGGGGPVTPTPYAGSISVCFERK
jgi:hypothetical protein